MLQHAQCAVLQRVVLETSMPETSTKMFTEHRVKRALACVRAGHCGGVQALRGRWQRWSARVPSLTACAANGAGGIDAGKAGGMAQAAYSYGTGPAAWRSLLVRHWAGDMVT